MLPVFELPADASLGNGFCFARADRRGRDEGNRQIAVRLELILLFEMIKIFGLIFAFFPSLVFLGCSSAPETKTEKPAVSTNSAPLAKPENTAPKPGQTIPIDVSKLADKPIAEFDRVFGRAEESKAIENGGEYRLYKIAGQPAGLAVRFYKGRAKNFNLILEGSFPTSKEALKKAFDLDVGNSAPVKDPKEPLSEKYQGTFGGVKFKKVSAKRRENGGGFIFVLAEVAE